MIRLVLITDKRPIINSVRMTSLYVCHRYAVDMIIKRSKGIDEMLNSVPDKEKAENRKTLYTMLSTVHFLAQQGLPLRGSFVGHGWMNPSNSNFMQLLQLCKDMFPI